MTITTLESANGNYKMHKGTAQEVLDAIEEHEPQRVTRFFHDGAEYCAVCYSG